MVSKSSAVRSIRLQNDLWEWLTAEAGQRGMTVNGLVSDLLIVGRLRAEEARAAAVALKLKPAPRPKSPPSAIDVVKAARPAKAAGGVDIPLHKPKAFNPQPKTGKTKR